MGNSNPNCARCGAPKNRNHTTAYCKPCERINAKAWRDANRDKLKVTQARYRASSKHKEKRDQRNAKRKIARQDPAFKAKERAYDYRFRLRYLYGITVGEVLEIQAAQNDRCAICGWLETNARIKTLTPSGAKVLSVDHNHHTGQIRELLCYRCNVTIGRVGEDPALLRQMVEYLERHNASKPENQ